MVFDCPLNRLMVQTGAPYNIPGALAVSGRSVSHSSDLLFIADKVASIKRVALAELMEQVKANVKEVFGIATVRNHAVIIDSRCDA